MEEGIDMIVNKHLNIKKRINVLFSKLEQLSKKPTFVILQKTFVSFSGLLLVSSLIMLLVKLPINNWQTFLGEHMINSLN